MPARDLARAARRSADQTTARFAEIPATKQVLATVAAIQTGAAQGGFDLVTVTWRGQDTLAAGYANGAALAVGNRVVCDYIDGQLVVAYRVVGAPF